MDGGCRQGGKSAGALENTAQKVMGVPVHDMTVVQLAEALLASLKGVDALLTEVVAW